MLKFSEMVLNMWVFFQFIIDFNYDNPEENSEQNPFQANDSGHVILCFENIYIRTC